MLKHEQLHDIVRRLYNQSVENQDFHKRVEGEVDPVATATTRAYQNVVVLIEALWDMPESAEQNA